MDYLLPYVVQGEDFIYCQYAVQGKEDNLLPVCCSVRSRLGIVSMCSMGSRLGIVSMYCSVGSRLGIVSMCSVGSSRVD